MQKPCSTITYIPSTFFCLLLLFEVCPEGIRPCTMKNRHLLKKIQDRRNTVRTTMTPQSPSKWAPWDLTQFSQRLFHRSEHSAESFVELPSAACSYFPESQWWSEISSFLKVILVLGKLEVLVGGSLYTLNIPRWPACGRPSRMWVTLNRFSTIYEGLHHTLICVALTASSPKAFGIIWIVSMEECSSLM